MNHSNADISNKDNLSERTNLRKFGSHLSSAFIAAIIARALSLVLTKILTNILPKAEFSSYSLWFALVTFLAVTSTSPYSASLWRFMETRRLKSKKEAASLLSTSYFGGFLTLSICVLILYFSFFLFGFQISIEPYYEISLAFSTFLASALVLKEFILVVSGTEQNAREIVSYNLFFSILSTISSTLFVIFFNTSLSSLLGLGIGFSIPAMVALGIQLRRYGVERPQTTNLKISLRFGSPNLFVTSSSTVIPVLANYFVMLLLGFDQISTLAIALTISSILSLAIGPPFTAYQAYIINTFENNCFDEARVLTEKLIILFVVLSGFFVIGMSVFASLIIEILSSTAYLDAIALVPLTVTSVAVIYLSYFWKLRIDLAERTEYTGAIHIVALGIFFALCPLLVSLIGLVGAALALLLNAFSILILTAIAGNKFYPIFVPKRIAANLMISFIGCSVVYYLLTIQGFLYPLPGIACLCAFLLIVFGMRVVRVSEIRLILNMLFGRRDSNI